MKILGGKKTKVEDVDAKVETESVATRRLYAQENSGQFTVGRTMRGEARSNHREIELERLTERKLAKRRNAFISCGLGLIILIVLFSIINYVTKLEIDRQEEEIVNQQFFPTEPTVTIVDENLGNLISSRTKVFIARLEADSKEYGFEIDHVVLPFQKSREVRVFVKDRPEYYKLTIERGSTEQAEDIGRMLKYLREGEVEPEYVDIRVEGKAYYK